MLLNTCINATEIPRLEVYDTSHLTNISYKFHDSYKGKIYVRIMSSLMECSGMKYHGWAA